MRRGGAAEELHRAKVPFVITDIDPDRVQRAMMAVNADATQDQTLRDAGDEPGLIRLATAPSLSHSLIMPGLACVWKSGSPNAYAMLSITSCH